MKTCLVLIVLAVVGIMLLDLSSGGNSASSSNSGGRPPTSRPAAPPPATEPSNSWERVVDMLGHAGDFFEGYTHWEYGMQTRVMAGDSYPVQVLAGVGLCVRDLLMLIGLYALLTMRRLLGRVGG